MITQMKSYKIVVLNNKLSPNQRAASYSEKARMKNSDIEFKKALPAKASIKGCYFKHQENSLSYATDCRFAYNYKHQTLTIERYFKKTKE